jgi:hypothetical protein
MGMQNDLWSDILAKEPRRTYFGFGDQFGGSGSSGRGQVQRNYFQNQFQPIFDEFTGQLSQNIMQGQEPFQQQSFQEFLGELPFSQRFASLPPSMRGGQRGRFAPQATFRF